MTIPFLRMTAVAIVLAGLAACSGPLPPATAPITNVNPITGSRGSR